MSRSNSPLSSIEDYVAKFNMFSGILLYSLIMGSTVFNAYLYKNPWGASLKENAPFVIPVILAIAFALYIPALAFGIRKQNGMLGALSWREAIHIVIFFVIMIVPLMAVADRSFFTDKMQDFQEINLYIFFAVLGVVILNGLKIVFERRQDIPIPKIVAPFIEGLGLLLDTLSLHNELFFNVWSYKPSTIRSSNESERLRSVRSHRAVIYSDNQLLDTFQQTVQTPYVESRQLFGCTDFRKSIDRLLAKGEIDVLDIGPAEGMATREFFAALADARVVRVGNNRQLPPLKINYHYCEHASFRNKAPEALRQVPGISVSPSFMGLFETSDEIDADAYDIILAYHSLYAIFDALRPASRLYERAPSLKHTLCHGLKQNGLLIVSLASQNGHSAELKREVLKELFGRVLQDATIDDVKRYWGMPDIHVAVDCFFQFPGTKDGAISDEYLEHWLQYFSRIPNEWLADIRMGYLLELMKAHMFAYEDLAEADKRQILSVFDEELLDRTRFLPHKTEVLVYGKEGR